MTLPHSESAYQGLRVHAVTCCRASLTTASTPRCAARRPGGRLGRGGTGPSLEGQTRKGRCAPRPARSGPRPTSPPPGHPRRPTGRGGRHLDTLPPRPNRPPRVPAPPPPGPGLPIPGRRLPAQGPGQGSSWGRPRNGFQVGRRMGGPARPGRFPIKVRSVYNFGSEYSILFVLVMQPLADHKKDRWK
jgi:hypothetical protein